MLTKTSCIINMYLYRVAERNILIILDGQGISRSSIDEIKFKNILKIQSDILKNSIRLTCANIGIVLIIFLLINEIFQEYININ